MTVQAGDRLARLLALVPWLVAHDGVTITECAAHFGVTPEQLELDLWLIVVCGIPGYGPDQLVDIQFWDDGVIHVLDPQTLGRPLRLTSEEALTLLVALRMLAQLPGIDDRDAILTAAAKLEAHASGAAPFVAVQVDIPSTIADAVDRALADGTLLRITYAAATRDEVTERVVRPVRVLAVDGLAYLEAHCLSADAVRTFRLDRVVAAEPLIGVPPQEETTEPSESSAPSDPPATPAAPVAPVRRATLLLAPEARWIIDVHEGATVVAEGPEGTRVHLPMHSVDWAVRLVLSQRGSAVAEDPADLVAAVAAAARAAGGPYAGQVP